MVIRTLLKISVGKFWLHWEGHFYTLHMILFLCVRRVTQKRQLRMLFVRLTLGTNHILLYMFVDSDNLKVKHSI